MFLSIFRQYGIHPVSRRGSGTDFRHFFFYRLPASGLYGYPSLAPGGIQTQVAEVRLPGNPSPVGPQANPLGHSLSGRTGTGWETNPERNDFPLEGVEAIGLFNP